MGLFKCPATGSSPWLVVSANGAAEELPAHVIRGDLNQAVTEIAQDRTFDC